MPSLRPCLRCGALTQFRKHYAYDPPSDLANACADLYAEVGDVAMALIKTKIRRTRENVSRVPQPFWLAADAREESSWSRGADVSQKVCPDCAEEVKEQARVCRHCGWSFARAERLVEALRERFYKDNEHRQFSGGLPREEADKWVEMMSLRALSDRDLLLRALRTWAPEYEREASSAAGLPSALPPSPSRGAPVFGVGFGVFDLEE